MEEKMLDNNRVTISGEITSDFRFSHKIFGESFYTADLSTGRTSEVVDTIPVMVSDRLINVKEGWKGRCVQIDGQFRSYNNNTKSGNHLILYVFAREFEALEGKCDGNYIFLDGRICKKPKYRITKLGREITDILLAVNRQYRKSDYIPCICWGRNARFAGKLNVGEHIIIEGRIQSREYQKRISDTETEPRVAYEVSAGRVETAREAES